MIRNSTIIPKKKHLKCGCFDYPFSKGMCKAHANVANFNKRLERVEEQESDESLQNLVDDADAIFSRYIRLTYLDAKTQKVPCYTCDATLPIGQIQNGHYIHRQDMATRFDVKNCRPQCPICNSRHNDDPRPFHDRLEAEEKGITDELLEASRQVCKPTRDEIKQFISEFRYKVKLLEKTKLKK